MSTLVVLLATRFVNLDVDGPSTIEWDLDSFVVEVLFELDEDDDDDLLEQEEELLVVLDGEFAFSEVIGSLVNSSIVLCVCS